MKGIGERGADPVAWRLWSWTDMTMAGTRVAQFLRYF